MPTRQRKVIKAVNFSKRGSSAWEGPHSDVFYYLGLVELHGRIPKGLVEALPFLQDTYPLSGCSVSGTVPGAGDTAEPDREISALLRLTDSQ